MSREYWVHVSKTNEEIGPFDTMAEASSEAADSSKYGTNEMSFVYRPGEDPIYLWVDGFKYKVKPGVLFDPRD